jgi:hypothetical protein
MTGGEIAGVCALSRVHALSRVRTIEECGGLPVQPRRYE